MYFPASRVWWHRRVNLFDVSFCLTTSWSRCRGHVLRIWSSRLLRGLAWLLGSPFQIEKLLAGSHFTSGDVHKCFIKFNMWIIRICKSYVQSFSNMYMRSIKFDRCLSKQLDSVGQLFLYRYGTWWNKTCVCKTCVCKTVASETMGFQVSMSSLLEGLIVSDLRIRKLFHWSTAPTYTVSYE